MDNPRPTRPDILSLRGVTPRHAVLFPSLPGDLRSRHGRDLSRARKTRPPLYPTLVNPDLFRFVNLTEEANLPTWFSALLWQVAALLAFFIANRHRTGGWPHRAYWIGMVPLFLFLSLD